MPKKQCCVSFKDRCIACVLSVKVTYADEHLINITNIDIFSQRVSFIHLNVLCCQDVFAAGESRLLSSSSVHRVYPSQ